MADFFNVRRMFRSKTKPLVCLEQCQVYNENIEEKKRCSSASQFKKKKELETASVFCICRCASHPDKRAVKVYLWGFLKVYGVFIINGNLGAGKRSLREKPIFFISE